MWIHGLLLCKPQCQDINLPWELVPGGETGIVPVALELVGQRKYTTSSKGAFDELSIRKKVNGLSSYFPWMIVLQLEVLDI